MGIKVQFNPSTGKVSYTAGTGKVQVSDDAVVDACAEGSCIGDMTSVKITVSSSVSCACFSSNPFPPGESLSYPDGVMDGEWILDIPSEVGDICRWLMTPRGFVGVNGLDRWYTATDCTGLSVKASFTTSAILSVSGSNAIIAFTTFIGANNLGPVLKYTSTIASNDTCIDELTWTQVACDTESLGGPYMQASIVTEDDS